MFLGKRFLPVYLSSFLPLIPLVLLPIKRIQRVGLCVTVALTSLCHFCDCLSRCKSAAEACSHPPSSLHSFTDKSARQQMHSHLFSCQKSVSLFVNTTQHNVTVKLPELWGSLHVLCGMQRGSTCFNCTVWFNKVMGSVYVCVKELRCVWMLVQCSLKVFGQ